MNMSCSLEGVGEGEGALIGEIQGLFFPYSIGPLTMYMYIVVD